MKSALAETVATGRHQQGLMGHKHEAIPSTKHVEDYRETRSALDVDEETLGTLERHLKKFQSQNRRRKVILSFGVIGILLFLYRATTLVFPGVLVASFGI